MRLEPFEVAAIKAAALEAFGDTATVSLFGSRVCDHDYPLDAEVQFSRLAEAVSYLPLLEDARARLVIFARDELPGKMP